jgi:hypothetical protein
MKQMKKNWHFFAMIGMMLLMASCESNSSDEPTTDNLLGGEGNILVEATVKNADGASGMSYIEQVSDLSGTLNLAKGVQIGFSGTLSVEGNDIYVFPEFGTSGKQVITKYEHTPK